jgi:TIR domain/Pentapeptide repeats (8 copies)
MANEDHVARLKQDITAWNRWRGENESVIPDLRYADLSGANLARADLSLADLRQADLRADMSDANLSHLDLDGTVLNRAVFRETILADMDLTNVIGLDTCEHFGPSSIDFRTLQKSPNLPLVFLRGVGLPDRLIDYLPSLLNQPITFYTCFISYSVRDDEFAVRLHADLQNKAVRCWFAPHDLPIGARIREGIDEAIRVRDKVLLILSEHSIQSGWVEDEVEAAFEEEDRRGGKPMLFPIRLDDSVMSTDKAWAAKLRRQRNIGDFRNWKDHDKYMISLERVLRDLSVPVPTVDDDPPPDLSGLDR